MATIKLQNEVFEDLLFDRRTNGDFSYYAIREWNCPQYAHGVSRTPHEIKVKVFASDRVQNAITTVCQTTNQSRSGVEAEAATILEEMGHNQKMSSIRFLGYVLSKCYKSMYRSIFVNMGGIEEFRKVTSKHPIVLLPTHRSYNDFLLLSYVCFYYNLPLPVTAAGLDFLGMPLVTMLLRNGGGFFMRRSFGSNVLYWEIFREYVQTVLVSKENCLEFFLEGTRSRSAKSMVPRTGLLTTILEMYFTSRVTDITFIPVTISYDRTLEENLYAYEMLGVPKPRESTSGLIKARGILNDDYGNIFIRFSKPISAQQFCANLVDRSLHSLEPRFIYNLTPDEAQAVKGLAQHAIVQHQKSFALSPFTLVCVALQTANVKAIAFQELDKRVRFLKELCEINGSIINLDKPSELHESLQVHANMICCDKVGVKLRRSVEGRKELSPTLRESLPHLLVHHYANQAMQLLAPFCMLATCSFLPPTNSDEEDFNRYSRLRTLFQREFVFDAPELYVEYDTAKRALEACSAEDVLYLSTAIRPYLRGYELCCRFLLNYKPSEQPPISELARLSQRSAEHFVSKHKQDYAVLSLDMINQCFLNLIDLNAAHKEQSKFLVIHVNEVRHLADNFEYYLGEKPCSQRVAIPSKM